MQLGNLVATLPPRWPILQPAVRSNACEVAEQLVPVSVVIEEATGLAATLGTGTAPASESVQRVALLHSLVALEVEFLRAADEPVPQWLLHALDETEWAATR